MKHLIIVTVLVTHFAGLLWAGSNERIRSEILWLIGAVEFKANERERLDKLGIGAVTELIDVMKDEMNPAFSERAVYLLARQYKNHLDALDETTKSMVISTLTRTTQNLNGWALIGALDALKEIHAPPIRNLAQQLESNPDENVKAAAQKLLQSMDKVGAEAATRHIRSTQQPPSPERAPDSKPTLPKPSEEPTSSTPWSVIVVLIVAACGLLWLLLKRRS